MRSAKVLLVTLMTAPPSVAAAQNSRVIEFGITAGTAHHNNRYGGEQKFEQMLGLRADIRVVPTRIGVVGVSLVFDRYGYNYTGPYCINPPTNDLSCETNRYPLNTPWRVDRRGAGLTLQHSLPFGFKGNLGALAGATERTYIGASPQPSYVPVEASPRQQWFRGLDGGLSICWRDLVIGVNGEYGRVPRRFDAPNPYYANVSARIAYALPVPHTHAVASCAFTTRACGSRVP